MPGCPACPLLLKWIPRLNLCLENNLQIHLWLHEYQVTLKGTVSFSLLKRSSSFLEAGERGLSPAQTGIGTNGTCAHGGCVMLPAGLGVNASCLLWDLVYVCARVRKDRCALVCACGCVQASPRRAAWG